MIFRLSRKEGDCCYQEWDRKEMVLVDCGRKSRVTVGKKYICREHLDFSLSMDSKADPRGKGDKEVTKVDFINYVDGCTQGDSK